MSWTEIENWEEYFPYKPRPVQNIMFKFIPKMLEKNVHMVLEAANGTGKTITALSAVLPYAKRNNLKVIYMARTHSQMDRVIAELEEINKQKKVNGIALRGRGSMCINSMVQKHANDNRAVQEICSQLKTAKKCEYFNNMANDTKMRTVMKQLLSRPLKAEYIFDMAEAKSICPAETAKLALPEVDVIACSYLYIFQPDIRKSFLESIDAELSDLVLIIDECHNLPDNVTSIVSDEVSTFSFNRAIREANNNRQDEFVEFLDACSDYLLKTKKNVKLNKEVAIDPAVFLEDVELKLNGIALDEEFFLDMIDLGNAIRQQLAKRGKEPRSSIGKVGEFFYRWFDSIGKVTFAHSYERKSFENSRDYYVTLRLDSLDPSIGILPVMEEVRGSIHMSGTIGDPEAYRMITGLDNIKSIANILPSPYDQKNIKVMVTKELTTSYKKRSTIMWTKMIHAIAAVVNNTPANTGIFVPSYGILNKILDNNLERWIRKPIYNAERGMSSEENDQLISKYKQKADNGGGVLFSVLGGRSSEGSDFPGDQMNSVIVIGIPYAPYNCRIDSQIEYMESKFPRRGRSLSYVIPAINRASQAAGRPVRGLNDRAFILFLDYRFAPVKIQKHLPEWIRSSLEVIDYDTNLIEREVKEFFNQL